MTDSFNPHGPVARAMLDKLNAAWGPCPIVLRDESARHAGHAGNPQGQGETHFHLTIVTPAFAGFSRVDRQRQVHAVLAEELAGPVHALSMTLHTPHEATAAKG